MTHKEFVQLFYPNSIAYPNGKGWMILSENAIHKAAIIGTGVKPKYAWSEAKTYCVKHIESEYILYTMIILQYLDMKYES